MSTALKVPTEVAPDPAKIIEQIIADFNAGDEAALGRLTPSLIKDADARLILRRALVRPLTLALRLFANMFAGHLLLILFSTGGLFLLEYGGIGYVAGPLAWVLAIAISFLELLVQFLQAYVFTLLNAMYISGALADEH